MVFKSLTHCTHTKIFKNINLYRRCNPIPWTIITSKEGWFGHLHRQPEDTPTKQAYKEVTEKPTKKSKGGQKLTWHQVITRDLNTINIDMKKIITLSQDRDLIMKWWWTA